METQTKPNLKEAIASLNRYLQYVKVGADPKVNEGDESIEVDSFTLFFCDGGWGVMKNILIPGCSYLPNGDPGYPEEWDGEVILEPSYDVQSIVGSKKVARILDDAIIALIEAVVKDRLNYAPFSFL